MPASRSVRAVAAFEAAKGVLVLMVGVGAATVMGPDAEHFARRLVAHLHLDAAKHYPHIFIDAASELTPTRLRTLAALAAVYVVVRLVEAYGLWRGLRWTQYFAVASAAIYIPFEIEKLLHGFHPFAFTALLLNLLVVGVMVKALRAHPVNAG